jgi:thioredoxin 1
MPALRAFCLCAAWCRNCDDYRPVFDAAAAQWGERGRFGWIDIEDDEALVGELDVADFPTLVIAVDGVPVFAGALTPQAGVLARLLRSAADGALPPLADAEVSAFMQRVARAGR